MAEPTLVAHDVEVVNNTDHERFELWIPGAERRFVGFLGYRAIAPGVYEVLHTVIGEAYGRQGYARTLVTKVLEILRSRGEHIVPTCTYVQDYLERFPQYDDVVQPRH